MRKISKEHQAKIAAIGERYGEAFGALQAAIADYNTVMQEIRDVSEEVSEAITEYTSERSDAWQESEKASAYEDWCSAWQDWGSVDDLDEPDELDFSSLPELES